MKYNFAIFLFAITITSCSVQKPSAAKWQTLFNGKNLNNWTIKIKGHPLGDNYKNTFIVKDGLLTVNYDEYKTFDELYGHIFYNKKFSNYFLEAEYRFIGNQTPDGPKWAYRNNGLMLHCQDPKTMGLNQDYPISIEAQLLGGDGKSERTNMNVCTPGTTVEMNGRVIMEHCTSSTSKTFPGDQWVKAQVLVLGDSLIRQYVNGELVMEYSKPRIGGENVHNYNPAVKKDGMLLNEGFIALQSESHPTEFREVKLVDLDKYRGNPERLNSVIKELVEKSLK